MTFNRKNIDWTELNKAQQLLKEAGFEEVCGGMADPPYTGDVPAYDSNFGMDYTLYPPESTSKERMAMTPDERVASYKEFSAGCIDLTLNYVSAPDIIAALS